MKPTMRDYDDWCLHPVTTWYMNEVLQGYANAKAAENGRSVGQRGDRMEDDYMILAKQAGHIEGVEFAVELDPFENKRPEEGNDETNSDRKATAD